MKTAREILGRDSRLDLEDELKYFEKVIGKKISAAYYPFFREGIEAREMELFGTPKFCAPMYGPMYGGGHSVVDGNEEGEP